MSLTKVTYAMIEGAAANVLDYGAIADGVADDTAAIQAASLAVSDAGGGVVYLPSGTYLANNLSIRNNVIFKGAGVGATIVKNASSTNHAFVSLVDVDNWGFEDLIIQNTDSLCLDGIRVIPATGTSRRWHLTNVRIEGGDNALNLVNCYLGIVNGLDILIGAGGRLNTGIHLGNSTTPTNANVWNEVWVTAAATYGIYLEKAATNTFNNPTVQSCTGGGIFCSASNSNVFINPYFESNTGAYDIKTNGQSDVIIGSYHAGTASKPTNTIVLNGNDCEAYAPNLPNAATPNVLIDTSAQKCKLFGGWYQNAFINQVTDNGAGTIYYGNTARRRVQALGVAAGVGSVSDADFYTYSGNADITSINATWPGHEIMILFSGNAATNGVVDGGNLRLAGNFAYTANDTIKLYCDGTNWYEISRSAN